MWAGNNIQLSHFSSFNTGQCPPHPCTWHTQPWGIYFLRPLENIYFWSMGIDIDFWPLINIFLNQYEIYFTWTEHFFVHSEAVPPTLLWQYLRHLNLIRVMSRHDLSNQTTMTEITPFQEEVQPQRQTQFQWQWRDKTWHIVIDAIATCEPLQKCWHWLQLYFTFVTIVGKSVSASGNCFFEAQLS